MPKKVNTEKPRLGEILRAANLIDDEQLERALEIQKQSGARLGSALVELKFIDENVLSAFLGMQKKVPGISLNNQVIDAALLALVPRDLAFEHGVVPVSVNRNSLTVAMTNPFDTVALEEIHRHTGMKIIPAIAPQTSIYAALKRNYGVEPVVEGPPGPATAGDSDDKRAKLVAKLREARRLLDEIELELGSN